MSSQTGLNPRSYLLNGFIIKRRNYGEADKIITVFSKQQGRTTLIAKGIRRIHSRRAAALELFNQTTVLIIKNKSGMDLISEVELDRNYATFGKDLSKTRMAFQLTELVVHLSSENQPNDELYELLTKAFDFIDATELEAEKSKKTAFRFKMRLLEILGFGAPSVTTHDRLNEYIETLIEKKLVAENHFEV